MSAPAVTVESSQDIVEAARVMLKDKIESLPVVEGGRLVVIITRTDLLREICRAGPSLLARGDGGGGVLPVMDAGRWAPAEGQLDHA